MSTKGSKTYKFYVVTIPGLEAEATTTTRAKRNVPAIERFLRDGGKQGEVRVYAPGQRVPPEVAAHVMEPV